MMVLLLVFLCTIFVVVVVVVDDDDGDSGNFLFQQHLAGVKSRSSKAAIQCKASLPFKPAP